MICRFLEKINCDRFYTFQCPTPFKRQRTGVGRVKRTIIPEAFHTIRLFHLHRFFINKVSRDQIIM